MADTDDKAADGVFTFEDLKALRDEYEDRIRRLESEGQARLVSDVRVRQELIEDLTLELATAREEGARRAERAERELHSALIAVARVELEIQHIKAGLVQALGPLVPVAPLASFEVLAADVVATAAAAAEPVGVATAPPTTVPPTAATPPPVPSTEADIPKRRKIRLR